MTLTVRSATVSGATTKGSGLTHAEMDANWAHVANFTPPGSGAIAEAVSTALRRLPHSSQYSTEANFNTAQAAVTGTLGVKAIRMGTGDGSGMVLPSSQANQDHYFYVSSNTFNSVVDPVLVWGYNPARTNASEPALYESNEGHYFDGGAHYMERNFDYVSSDGGTSKRFMEFQVNRSTHLATWFWTGSTFSFGPNEAANGTYLFLNSTTMSLGNQSPSASTRIEINGTQNAATSEFGIDYLGKAGSGVTNTLAAFVSHAGTAAAAFTCSLLQHFAATDGTKGSGSTITVQAGFRVATLTNGASNYGFYGELAAASNTYNLYMSGTAQNHLAGVTGIGIAASATAALALAASTTGVASLRLPHGSAPSAPVNGDMWTTTAGLFVRIDGVTIGPLAA